VVGTAEIFGGFLARLEVTNGNSSCQVRRDRRRSDLQSSHPLAEGGPLNVATVRSEMTPQARTAIERAGLCARVAEENKARDVAILDMRGITPLYDFLILATGTSRRQIHTLAEEIDAAMHAEGEKRLSIEGYDAGNWVVQDYGDIVVHVFNQDTRDYYALEDLWADAPHLEWQRI
jgi:ribosome-associated protein